jgi:ferredoxin-NADP reductase
MAQPTRLRARIAKIEVHAPGVRSFVLAPQRPAPRFRPGQFLHLALDPYDPSQHWPESRVFSIASPPQDREQLRITVSEVGTFTRRMMLLREGDELWVKLPYGDFVIEPRENEPLVLLAGGTGITPFLSFLASTDVSISVPVRVLYGARRSELLIYRSVLDQAVARFRDLGWGAFVEENARPGEHQGRLSVEAALDAAQAMGRPDVTTFHVSGPPSMLRFFQAGLAAAKVAPARIRIDAWD